MNGALVVDGSTFTGNKAGGGSTSGSGNGGGIYNVGGGNLTLSSSTLSANDANLGGGLYNDSAAAASGNTFAGNTADLACIRQLSIRLSQHFMLRPAMPASCSRTRL
jgi:hypothetical protein